MLAEDAAASAEANGVTLESNIAPGIRISGDAPPLRTAILNARGQSLPRDTIDRAIKKASGSGESSSPARSAARCGSR